MVAKVDKLDLTEHYSSALKACHDVAFYLSHSFRDFGAVSGAQAEVEKLRGELSDSRSREEKLVQEVQDLKGRLSDFSRENARLTRDLEKAASRHDELSSSQKELVDQSFSYIMMEVWSADPRLVVSRVEKRVDKLAILRAMEDIRKTIASISGSPLRSAGVAQVPPPELPSDAPTCEGHTSATSASSIDHPAPKEGEDDVPLTA